MDAVADIKSKLNIEDVVSEYVALKRAGRNFKGLSPFTTERTPSFIVSPEKQIWHDFSSGRGGDMFSFIQEVEGVDFKRALELLARKSGIDLDQYSKTQSGSSQKNKQEKERLYEAVELAVRFYQRALLQSSMALDYVRKTREFSKQTILDFAFGYSPEKGSPLMDYLLSKGFKEQELKKVGLVGERDGRYFDLFRGRLMIPLRDSQGRPVGFTARLLKSDDNAPKYINTPATILYDKGRQLYGFSQAKQAIRKSGFVVVVEGNLDVVASHQAGVANVVASAGTALTEFHLKDLQRFTGDIRIAFDSDRAGQTAAERTVPLAQKLKLDMSVITIPEGKDPDELVKDDPNKWLKVIDENLYMIDWLIQQKEQSYDLKTAQGKRSFADDILQIVTKLEDPVEREHYISRLSEKTGTSVESLNKKLQLTESPGNKPAQRKKPTNIQQSTELEEQRLKLDKSLQHLLAIASANTLVAGQWLPAFSDSVCTTEENLSVKKKLEKEAGTLPTDTDYGKMIALLYEETYQHTDRHEQLYQAQNIAIRLAEQFAKYQKDQLLNQFETADEEQEKQLLNKVRAVDAERQRIIELVRSTSIDD